MKDYISIGSLAREMGVDKTNIRRYAISHGIKFIKRRDLDTRNQLANCLTHEDADLLREIRREEGFDFGQGEIEIEIEAYGYYYIVQLIPELDPLRIKVGYTNNIIARLGSHRTAAPTAELVKSWPCKSIWEKTITDSITRKGCRPISNEVFVCEQLEETIKQADKIFALLPILKVGG